ncbi:MAG: NAD(P)-dependent oxidoreductase, partial [Acidimicrobiia bacterium]|nr:NAD(P)-dependent oxidoreductase [Acidimicrobiia bacterium]
MVERDRVLMSCKLVWDSLDEYGPILESHAIDIDAPRFEGQQLDEKDLLPVIDGYAGILAGDDILNRRVIEAASRLRVISKWGIGVDAIDLDAAKEAGIKVFNTPGVFGDELGDYALGYLLMLARRQHEVDRRVRLGQWYKVRGTSLAGKTIGIIGLGSSGSALARRTAA